MRIRTFSTAHILQEFRLRCQTLAANDNAGFRQEFEGLNDVGKEFSTRAGDLDANRYKNRYPFILPYDHCRVRLSLLESQLHSDYINANYVPGGSSEHDFICTQGPLRSTMADFWRMVWEQNVQVIVMVTALKENGKVQCDQYWPPEGGAGCYGAVQVTTVSQHQRPESSITTIQLKQRGCPAEKTVVHYLYPSWPDQGVPQDPASLCTLTEHVRQHLDETSSLGHTVVHCSAGVGRSGSFVALLWLLQLCARGVPPDVKTTVQDLRRHRVMMVQNLEQYILVHKCLLRWLDAKTRGPRSRTESAPVQAEPARHHGSRQSGCGQRGRRNKQPDPTHAAGHTPAPHTAQPQQSALQTLQTSLQTLHPANLLWRILPTSLQPNTHTHIHPHSRTPTCSHVKGPESPHAHTHTHTHAPQDTNL